MTRSYAGGHPLPELEEDLSRRKQELAEEEVRLEVYRRANVPDYKARVDEFNRGVRAAKAAMREYRRRRSAVARRKSAFNRCLDPKILFTRFGRWRSPGSPPDSRKPKTPIPVDRRRRDVNGARRELLRRGGLDPGLQARHVLR